MIREPSRKFQGISAYSMLSCPSLQIKSPILTSIPILNNRGKKLTIYLKKGGNENGKENNCI
jgi:hypothetical protein